MPAQSSAHFYFNWTKERIDEMDAILASLEAKAGEVQADSRIRAEQLIADLHKKRDEFQKTAKRQADAGEAMWLHTKSQLEGTWKGFETEVKRYVETYGKQIQQQQTTFQDAAAAQLRAWRDAAEKIQTAATGLAVHRRSDIDAAVTRMKADASKAEANLEELKRAGTDSWAALNGALVESRAAFDRANQAAWDALKRAATPDR
jgi:gas vesicle protein